MALDLSTLNVVRDVDMPKTRRGRTPSENPLLPLVVESHENGNRSMALLDIPAADTREAVNYIRYAANDLKIGVRVYLETADTGHELTLARKTVEDEDGNAVKTGLDIVFKDEPTAGHAGHVNIRFRTGKRKERKAGANGETPDATDEADRAESASETDADVSTVTETVESPTHSRRSRKR